MEVNSTFYRLARPEAVRRWVEATPDGFQFAVKASRYLTHIRRLTDSEDGIRRFYEPLTPMIEAGRLGPVLWQLPENFRRDEARLGAWLDVLPPGWHTIEFRDASWFVPAVLEQLRQHGVALTIGDHPARAFQSYEATADWRFIRFHYGSRGVAGTTRPGSSTPGPSGSMAGGARGRSGRTSTTTGGVLPRATPPA